MTIAYETIRYEGPDTDGIVRITLHRPERLNTFRDRGEPEFTMRVPDDLPAAYPWWEPDEWST